MFDKWHDFAYPSRNIHLLSNAARKAMLNAYKICLLAALLAMVNPVVADPMTGQALPPAHIQKPESYGAVISNKLGSGFSNIGLCFAELPKNVINTTNDANLALGLTGGVLKGVLHMVGRAMAGTVDVLTFPIPTVPITNPPFVWQDFKTGTRYNPLFKFQN
jgi:putative exosortase-associated protein (TIGR04073 family)